MASSLDFRTHNQPLCPPVPGGNGERLAARIDRPHDQTAPVGKTSSLVRTLLGVQVLGTGSAVPENVVRNEDLAQLGCDPQWIVQRSGIRERRHAPPGVAASDLAFEAARKCIEQSGIDPAEIDLVVAGTYTPDRPMPSLACVLQHRLGLTAGAMDLNAACAGFMYAAATAMQFVKAGTSRAALVVAADITSRVVNPDDKKTYPLFGDAAGAVLVGPGGAHQGFPAYTLGSDGAGAGLLCIPCGGSREPAPPEAIAAGRHYMQMEGRAIFKWAVRLIADTSREVLCAAGLTIADVDLVVLHQANARILDAAADLLGVSRERVLVNLDRYGNTSAGSIPLALDEAHRQGRIRRGDLLLLCGFGAGLSWGTALLRW